MQVMQGEEEEEVAMVGNTMGDYRNVKCPLSGVDIHDLKDPVWDQEQIIYEREAIEVRPLPCSTGATSAGSRTASASVHGRYPTKPHSL
jgi:hypothetical protein